MPTHFAKVVLTSKPSSPSTPNIPDLALGAFVLPNAVIKDEAPLEGFVVPGTFHSGSGFRLQFMTPIFPLVEAVEKASGLTLFSEEIKDKSKHICKATQCQVTIRRFDDAQRKVKTIGAPKH